MKNDKKSLNEILDIYQDLESKIIESDGAVNDEMENLLNVNELDLKNKLDGYQGFIKYLEGQISYLKSMESHFAKRRKTLENSILRCRKSMTEALLITNRGKVKTNDFNFSIGKSDKWTVDSENIDEKDRQELLSLEFAENIFKINISKLKAHYKEESEIEKPDWINIDQTEFIKVR